MRRVKKFRGEWTCFLWGFPFHFSFLDPILFFLELLSYPVSQISLVRMDPPNSIQIASIWVGIGLGRSWASWHGPLLPSWPCMSFGFAFWHVASLLSSLFYSFAFGSKTTWKNFLLTTRKFSFEIVRNLDWIPPKCKVWKEGPNFFLILCFYFHDKVLDTELVQSYQFGS